MIQFNSISKLFLSHVNLGHREGQVAAHPAVGVDRPGLLQGHGGILPRHELHRVLLRVRTRRHERVEQSLHVVVLRERVSHHSVGVAGGGDVVALEPTPEQTDDLRRGLRRETDGRDVSLWCLLANDVKFCVHRSGLGDASRERRIPRNSRVWGRTFSLSMSFLIIACSPASEKVRVVMYLGSEDSNLISSLGANSPSSPSAPAASVAGSSSVLMRRV